MFCQQFYQADKASCGLWRNGDIGPLEVGIGRRTPGWESWLVSWLIWMLK